MLSSEGDNQSEEDSKEVIASLVFLFFVLNFCVGRKSPFLHVMQRKDWNGR
jgi:hypothetical protein